MFDRVTHRRVRSWSRVATPAFFHLREEKVCVSNFGVQRGILPLSVTSDITMLSVSDIASVSFSGRMRDLPQALETSGTEGFLWPTSLLRSLEVRTSSSFPDGFLVPGQRTGGIFFHSNGKCAASPQSRRTPSTMKLSGETWAAMDILIPCVLAPSLMALSLSMNRLSVLLRNYLIV